MNFLGQKKKLQSVHLFNTFITKNKRKYNRTLLIFMLFAGFILYFQACKKKSSGDNNNNNTPDQALFQTYNYLTDTKLKFLDFADSTNGDPKQAIMLTKKWLDQQPDIVSTDIYDSTYLIVTDDNGLGFDFNFMEINQDSSSVYRGGGAGGSAFRLLSSSGNCSKVIQNKKILIYAAYFKPAQKILDYLNNSDKNLEVTLLTGKQCKPELVETFDQYGLVILDTHGVPDGFLSGVEITYDPKSKPTDFNSFRDQTIKQIGEDDFNKLVSGEFKLLGNIYYHPADKNWWKKNSQYFLLSDIIIVTSAGVKASNQLTNTIVFGNFCYSGWQYKKGKITAIGSAFIDQNPASYFAYAFDDQKSAPVSDVFAREMEDSLVRSLVVDGDSTGVAYLKSDNTEYYDPGIHYNHPGKLYFKHFDSPSWCYGGCGEPFTDARDGQQYQTVCIGTQTWMAQNLNWAGAGVCYDNDPSNCEVYGRLYSQEEVMNGASPSDSVPSGVQGICPDGWHVPSSGEYKILEKYLGAADSDYVAFDNGNSSDGIGGSQAVGAKLRDAAGWAENNNDDSAVVNKSGFSALPAGVEDIDNGMSYNINTEGVFRTTSDFPGTTSHIVRIILSESYGPTQWIINCQAGTSLNRYSLRCLKDK